LNALLQRVNAHTALDGLAPARFDRVVDQEIDEPSMK